MSQAPANGGLVTGLDPTQKALIKESARFSAEKGSKDQCGVVLNRMGAGGLDPTQKALIKESARFSAEKGSKDQCGVVLNRMGAGALVSNQQTRGMK